MSTNLEGEWNIDGTGVEPEELLEDSAENRGPSLPYSTAKRVGG